LWHFVLVALFPRGILSGAFYPSGILSWGILSGGILSLGILSVTLGGGNDAERDLLVIVSSETGVHFIFNLNSTVILSSCKYV